MSSTLFDELLAQAQHRRTTAAEAQRAQAEQERLQATEKLRGALNLAIPIAIQDQLGMVLEWEGNEPVVVAPLFDPPHTAVLSYSSLGWAIRLGGSDQANSTVTRTLKREELLDILVLWVDEQRKTLAAIAKDHERRAQRTREFEEREARDRVEVPARALAEHAACLARVEQQIAAFQQHRWAWGSLVYGPGMTAMVELPPLRLYRWTWQIGAAFSDQGDVAYDYDSGWALTDQPDADGYVTLQPFLSAGTSRQIKLDIAAHRMVIERIVARAVADLPAELREPVTLTIEGIQTQGRFESATSRAHYVELPQDQWDSRWLNGHLPLAQNREGILQVRLGEQPVAWVREAIKGQAQRVAERNGRTQ